MSRPVYDCDQCHAPDMAAWVVTQMRPVWIQICFPCYRASIADDEGGTE